MNIFLSDERVVTLNSKNLNANLFIKLADHKIKLNSMINVVSAGTSKTSDKVKF